MGGVESVEASAKRGGRPGKINAPLSKKLSDVKWGEFTFSSVFNRIEQGRRLKKDDQLPGHIPFVMAGTTNRGVVNYISNPIAVFPKNSITVDIFGNAFYRNYVFGAGDDTGVYWNDSEVYSPETMLFFTMSMGKAMHGMFSFGKKLRSSQSLNLTMQLPILENGAIDFAFMESFIAELEAERVAELEAERVAELEAYLTATGLQDYTLTEEEQIVLRNYSNVMWKNVAYKSIFNRIAQGRRLKKEDQISGNIPFVMSGTTNTGVVNFISNPVTSFPKNSITVDIFGNVFYRNYDFGAGDDTGVYWNDAKKYSKEQMIFFAASMKRSLLNKFSYGKKLRSSESYDIQMMLPVKNGKIDYDYMNTLISAIQKLVIQDVVRYTKQKVEATKTITTH